MYLYIYTFMSSNGLESILFYFPCIYHSHFIFSRSENKEKMYLLFFVCVHIVTLLV